MELVITAGECLKELLGIDGSVAFNEAMSQGLSSKVIMSEDFIQQRCRSLNVEKKEYLDKLGPLILAVSHIEDYSSIVLCFGKDTFCIINIITLLAWLENKQYQGIIHLQFYNEYTGEPLEKVNIELGKYQSLYESVLLDHQVSKTNIPEINDGIKEYIQEWEEK